MTCLNQPLQRAGVDVRLFAIQHRLAGAVSRLFWLLLLVSGVAHAQRTVPYIPAGPDVVLQHVPQTTDPRVRQFDQLRDAQRKQPHDASRATALARAYIDYGRSTGDARYLGRAMAVISPFMKQPQPPIPVLLLHATVQQSRHAFTAARGELNHILERDPGNAQAWLTLATVAMVQGDHPLANRACVKVADTAGDFMGLVCSASLRSLSGHSRQAYTLLTLVQDPGPKAPPAIRAWIEGLMGDVAARQGHAKAADAHYRQALQWTPGDNFLLADYGQFLLDQGRPREALNLVRDDAQSDTSFLIQVAAEIALDAPEAAADIDTMKARFASMDERGDHVFLREEASFLLHVQHDPKGALALAQANWKNQRAPNDVRIYLASALAAKQPAAALPVLAFVQGTGLRDVTIDPLVQQLKAQLGDDPGAARPVRIPPPSLKAPPR